VQNANSRWQIGSRRMRSSSGGNFVAPARAVAAKLARVVEIDGVFADNSRGRIGAVGPSSVQPIAAICTRSPCTKRKYPSFLRVLRVS
jgi:hypothetical protein